MTTGATAQLGLALPVQGELSGTWGDTVNNGITQYTNIAIAGTLTLTNDGAVTLANTTGDASASNITSSLTGAGTVTAQFAIVRVTGTLTTAKVVTGPSYSKTYTVVNSATGGIVTFKASGQTGVSIAVGETAFVYFNGTDYVKVVGTATAGAAGGSNTQVQFNSSGILSGSSSLTWDGTTLSSTQVNITGQGTLRLQDTTGGEYVGLRSPSALGASYTLTFPADDGTSGQALITDGSGVLSWSTAASGDVYGPASSTDNAVARFDSTTGKLLQNSVVLIGDTGAVTGVTDLTASGSVTLSGGTANGVAYLNGSKVVTSGSALTFDGTFANLTLTSGTTANGFLQFSNSADGGTQGYIGDSKALISGGANSSLAVRGESNILFGIASAEQMRLTSTGLGIGTSSPTQKLDVAGGNIQVRTSYKVITDKVENYGAALTLNAAGSLPMYFALNGTTSMTLDASGNLGLGVTPSAWSGYQALQIGSAGGLSMFGYSNAAEFGNNYYYNAGYKYGATASSTNYVQTAGQHRWFNAPSGTAGNAITFTQAMTLDSGGNWMVGTTTAFTKASIAAPSTATSIGSNYNPGILNIQNSSATNGNLSLIGFQDASAFVNLAAMGAINTTHSGSPNSVVGELAFYTKPAGVLYIAERMRLDSSGNLGLGVTPSAWSSIFKVLQIGAGASYLGGRTDSVAGRQIWLGTNSYYDGTNWIYGVSQPAAQYYQNDGAHIWNTAPSGTAGNAITFTQAMTLNASGNLGIGVTSPSQKLDVNGNITSTAWLGRANGSAPTADCAIYRAADNTLAFSTGSTERARIDSSGNLLVGSTTGGEKIYAYASSGNCYVSSNRASKSSGQVALRLGGGTGGTDWIFYQETNSDNLNIFGNSSTRMTVTTGGNLLVGTTSDQNRRLQVSGTLALLDSALNSVGDMSIDSSGNMYLAPYNGSGSTIVFQTAPSGSGTTERARITSTGQVLIGTTSTSGGFPLRAKGGGVDGSTTVTVPSGVTTTIYTVPNSATACMCVVFGDNGSSGFCDLLFFLANTTPQVITSKTMYGSPPARTYSVASNTQLQLNVAMDSSTRTAVLGTIS